MSEAVLSEQAKALAHSDLREKVLKRFNLGDRAFHAITKASAIAVLVLLGGVIVSLVHGSAPGAPGIRLRLLHLAVVEPGHREIRRRAGDLRHAGHLVPRPG